MLARRSAIVVGALLLVLFAFPASIFAQWNHLNPITSVKKQVDGVVLTMNSGTLRLLICSDSIVRVTYAPESSIPETPQYAVTKQSWPASQWTLESSDNDVKLTTSQMKVTVTKKDGAISFADAPGKGLFQDYDRTVSIRES
jgi:hypothetical protein